METLRMVYISPAVVNQCFEHYGELVCGVSLFPLGFEIPRFSLSFFLPTCTHKITSELPTKKEKKKKKKTDVRDRTVTTLILFYSFSKLNIPIKGSTLSGRPSGQGPLKIKSGNCSSSSPLFPFSDSFSWIVILVKSIRNIPSSSITT